MNEKQLESIKRKNAWLHDLVEVEFPTKESLEGREIYTRLLEEQTYQVVEKSSLLEKECHLASEDIFLVDFHRLTVMFSILQSQRWSDKHEQEMIVEYLTQIILTPEFELYVGFAEGEAIGAAMVSQYEGNTVITDTVTSHNLDKAQFVSDLATKLNAEQKLSETVVLEN